MYNYLIAEIDEDDGTCVSFFLTDNVDKIGYGYEIYKINNDGSTIKIKEFDTPYAMGMAVVKRENGKLTVLQQIKNISHLDCSKEQIKTIKKQYGFHGKVEKIYTDIRQTGWYFENIGNAQLSFEEYYDEIGE